MLEGQKCTNSIKANSKKQKWWVKNPSIAKVNKKGVITGKKPEIPYYTVKWME